MSPVTGTWPVYTVLLQAAWRRCQLARAPAREEPACVPGGLRDEGTGASGGLFPCARPGARDEGGAALPSAPVPSPDLARPACGRGARGCARRGSPPGSECVAPLPGTRSSSLGPDGVSAAHGSQPSRSAGVTLDRRGMTHARPQLPRVCPVLVRCWGTRPVPPNSVLLRPLVQVLLLPSLPTGIHRSEHRHVVAP